MVTKIIRILFFINQLSTGSLRVSLVIFRAQARLLYIILRGASSHFGHSKRLTTLRERSKTRGAHGTHFISHTRLPSSLPLTTTSLDDRIFPRSCLDLAHRRDRAIVVIFEFLSLTRRDEANAPNYRRTREQP